MLLSLLKGLYSDAERLAQGYAAVIRLEIHVDQLLTALSQMKSFEELVSAALDTQNEKIQLLSEALAEKDGLTAELQASLASKDQQLAAFMAEEQAEEAAEAQEDSEREARQEAVLQKLRDQGLLPADEDTSEVVADPSSVTLE